jgi:hypothetical protein
VTLSTFGSSFVQINTSGTSRLSNPSKGHAQHRGELGSYKLGDNHVLTYILEMIR